MYVHSTGKHRRSGTSLQKLKGRGMTKRYMDSRKIKAGYPIDRAFGSEDEVQQYLSGDRITCLLCGKDYKGLMGHTKIVHGIDIQDYRLKYNIPAHYGLMCAPSIAIKKEADTSHLLQYAKSDVNKNRVRNLRTKPRLCEMVIKKHAAKVLPFCQEKDDFEYTDFSWHLNEVAKNFRFKQVVPPKGTASWRTYKRRRFIDTKLNADHQKAKEARKSNVH